MTTCPRCGLEADAGFRFCPSCGSEVGPVAREERRTVTVVFCDLAGSTALGESLDPERLRRVLADYFERMKGIVEAHGGTVEKFIGDAVMAVFGVPVVHEDDALRAVRAAHEMRDALPSLGLAGRIGVMTGEVVTGTSERLVTGDAVNVAARLEQAAPPGEVLVGAPTLELVRGAVEVESVEPLQLKGKAQPVPAFRLLDVGEAPDRPHTSAFVGRSAELDQVRAAIERVGAERRCELVTVVGEAGIGKSRLVAEALDGVEATVVRGRCLPYGSDAYRPVVEVLRQLSAQPPPAAAEGVRALLDADAAAVSPDETAWAVRQTLEAAAADGTLVVVLDDVQWAEPGLHDLVEHVALLSTGAPILLLCMARPELVERRPTWPISVRLTELSGEAVGRLLADLDDEALRRRIATASGGNPLFVTEMLAITGDGGTGVAVPPTLRALLEARLGQLEPDERAVLEIGSVEGEVFHRGAVQAASTTDAPLTPRLAALVRKGLIRPEATLVADDAYRFSHLLLRDTAYESLPKAVRADLHERLTQWLALHVGELGELDDVVGHHFAEAARYRRELGTPDVDAERQARGHLVAAGRRAQNRGEHLTGLAFLERAAEQAPDDPVDARFEIDLAWARFNTNAPAEAVLGGLDEARRRAEEAGDTTSALAIYVERVTYAYAHAPTLATADAVRRAAEAARPLLEAAADDFGLAVVYGALVNSEEAEGRPWAQVSDTGSKAAEHASRVGWQMMIDFGEGWAIKGLCEGSTSFTDVLAALEGLSQRRWQVAEPIRARALAALGRSDEARAILAALEERVAEIGMIDAYALAFHRHRVSMLAGDLDGALEEARTLEQLARDAGHWGTADRVLVAAALLALRRDDEAEPLLDATPIDEGTLVPVRTSWLEAKALCLARRGAVGEAEPLAREAVELAARGDAVDLIGGTRTALAEVLERAGRIDEARAELALALDAYERKESLVAAARVAERLAVLAAKQTAR